MAPRSPPRCPCPGAAAGAAAARQWSPARTPAARASGGATAATWRRWPPSTTTPRPGTSSPTPPSSRRTTGTCPPTVSTFASCSSSSEPSVVCKIPPSCSRNSSLLKHDLVVMVFDVCFVQYLIHHTAYNLELNFQYCTVLTFPTGPICLLEKSLLKVFGQFSLPVSPASVQHTA